MDPQRLIVVFQLMLAPVDVWICVLAIRRRVWTNLPWFAVYAVALVITGILRWGVFFFAGTQAVGGWNWDAILDNGPLTYSYRLTYWLSQPIMILARAATLADICRTALRPYGGIWRLAKPLLMITATALLGFAAIRSNAGDRMRSYFLLAERELEFAIVFSLLALLVLSRYYGVQLYRPLSGIALGMGLYSSYVIVEYTFRLQNFQIPWWVFSVCGSVAFLTAEVIWLRSLWLPLPATTQPELSTAESYQRNSVAVSEQMKAVTSQLSELMKH